MDLATLDVDVERAKAGLDEYRTALRSERNAEDEAIAAAYRAAARGLPIISLSAAIMAGGFFSTGLPRIAIARADATRCRVDRSWGGRGLVFRDEHARLYIEPRSNVGTHSVTVWGDVPQWLTVGHAWTTVPPVPPRHRPKRSRARLARYHVLWEVEAWDPTPPHDPALLRHIRGDLWAVLATWDLTEVERHVLGQRAVRP